MDLSKCASLLGIPAARIAPVILTLISVLVASCGGGGGSTQAPPPPGMTYTAKSGVAQKGPLIKGSTVTAAELDSSLSPTGKQYSYQTTSDIGTFSPTATTSTRWPMRFPRDRSHSTRIATLRLTRL